MDVGITADDAFRLEIKDGYDFNKRAVSPFGPVRFLPLLDSYIFLKNFINDEKGWNYVSFGFDWRRSLTESAHMLHYFLEEFRDRVKGKSGRRIHCRRRISSVTVWAAWWRCGSCICWSASSGFLPQPFNTKGNMLN